MKTTTITIDVAMKSLLWLLLISKLQKNIVYAKHYYTYTIKYLRATKENVLGTSNIRKVREEEIKWGKG